MFPVQGGSAVTPECHLLSIAGEVLGQGTGWLVAGGVGAEGLSCCASSTHGCCTVAAKSVPGPSSCHLKSNKWFAVEQMG